MATVGPLTNTTSETPSEWQDTELPDLAALEALDLPDSDGEPMENERERIQINLVIELLYQHWSNRNDFFAGGNMFVYYSISQARAVIEELSQVWQTIQQLSWSEQHQLMQLLLQAWQRHGGGIPQTNISSQVKAIRGKYAFVPTSSEAFAKRKQQEIELGSN